MAWRFHAIDATVAPWSRQLDGVEDNLTHWLISTQATCTRIRRRLLPLARSRVRDNRSEKHDQLLNDAGRRALFERYNRLDMALYRNATQIWCAEWYKALRDRESCVRTYAHAHPGTPSPCST